MGRPRDSLLLALIGALGFTAGCASGPPGVKGVAGVAPSPAVPWRPSAEKVWQATPSQPAVPLAQVEDRLQHLTLAEVVDIALENSPATRAAWDLAKAAAGQYGADRAERWPSIQGTASASRGNSAGTSGGTSAGDTTGGSAATAQAAAAGPWRSVGSATASLSYLLFDFGGRGGRIEESRQLLLAADWTHNAAIQDRILAVEVAFFEYGSAKAILEANSVSLAEADSSLAAAEARHQVGLATIADVLQARTARAQAQLDLQATEGQVRTTKGALAVSMGYRANVPYDIEVGAPEIPENAVAESVEALIDRAVAGRPDLQAARAEAQAARAVVRQRRSDMLPSLYLSGSAGRTWVEHVADPIDRTTGALVLDIPVFSGFSGRYKLAQAEAQADAAGEQARGVEQQVIFEVFSAHSDLLTATESVKTANDLIASAQQSQEVALGRYREGVGSILDLLSAQRALAVARAQQVNARLSWFTALAQLARNVGVLGLHGENPVIPGIDHPEVKR